MDRRISIVIVSHDLHEYLERCIIQIEGNTERHLLEDIVIVDNGSQKKYRLEELRELTSFPVSLVRLLKNTSYSRANNRGVESARGYYICFMNNDIEVLSGWLTPLYEIINGDEKIGAVGPKMIFPDGSIQFAGYEQDPKTGFQRHTFRDVPTLHTIPQANVAGPVSSLTGACLMVRRKDAHFDERYWYGCEDVDLCTNLKRKKKVIFYEPRSVVLHHEEKSRAAGMVPIDYERNRLTFKKKWGKDWEQLLWNIVS